MPESRTCYPCKHIFAYFLKDAPISDSLSWYDDNFSGKKFRKEITVKSGLQNRGKEILQGAGAEVIMFEK